MADRYALVVGRFYEALADRLLEGAARVLRPRGAVAVEVGAGLSTSLIGQVGAAGFQGARTVQDLQDVPRVIVATWNPDHP